MVSQISVIYAALIEDPSMASPTVFQIVLTYILPGNNRTTDAALTTRPTSSVTHSGVDHVFPQNNGPLMLCKRRRLSADSHLTSSQPPHSDGTETHTGRSTIYTLIHKSQMFKSNILTQSQLLNWWPWNLANKHPCLPCGKVCLLAGPTFWLGRKTISTTIKWIDWWNYVPEDIQRMRMRVNRLVNHRKQFYFNTNYVLFVNLTKSCWCLNLTKLLTKCC